MTYDPFLELGWLWGSIRYFSIFVGGNQPLVVILGCIGIGWFIGGIVK